MKTVVFLCQNLAGHLNPTLLIAKEFQKRGFKVYYAGLVDLIQFTNTNCFEYYPLNSLPYAVGFDSIIHQGKREKWLESLIDRFSNKRFKHRKTEIEKLFQEINPDWIFLDEFNYTDFIFCYPFKNEKRIIQLQTKFPDYKNSQVPPSSLYEFPGNHVTFLWRKYLFIKRLKAFLDNVIYLGRSDYSLLKNAMRTLKIDSKFQISNEKTFMPTFSSVEEWFLAPKELDFDLQCLRPWQHYIGPMINFNKPELLDSTYLAFINKKNENVINKLIYCSLGTVLKSHLNGRYKTGQKFFQNLIKIANDNPQYYFIISLEKDLQRLYISGTGGDLDNVLLVNFAPQFAVLKHCDLFLTHAGLGSIIESIITSTPMLLLPLNNRWDQNGNAARIVFKGMGIKCELSNSMGILNQKIDLILKNSIYKSKISKFCVLIKKKYDENYFVKLLNTEQIVQ